MSEWPELDRLMLNIALLNKLPFATDEISITENLDRITLSVLVNNANQTRNSIPVYGGGIFLTHGKWEENVISYLENIVKMLKDAIEVEIKTAISDIDIPEPSFELTPVSEEEFLEIAVSYPEFAELIKAHFEPKNLCLIPNKTRRELAFDLNSGSYAIVFGKRDIYGFEELRRSPRAGIAKVIPSVIRGYV